jgi:hypothetical protein
MQLFKVNRTAINMRRTQCGIKPLASLQNSHTRSVVFGKS